jgi:D-ribulokinase
MEIWNGIASSVRACLAEANVSPSTVKGLGFDATCSLAVSDERGKPVTVTKGKNLGMNGERNVILWADHRAEAEAELINASGSIVLNYVGGKMSVSFI